MKLVTADCGNGAVLTVGVGTDVADALWARLVGQQDSTFEMTRD